ncbi:tape measure protein, partial [Lactobacillus hominis]
MSVISTTIKINDAFSGALSKLASGLGKAQTGMKVLKGALSSGTNSFGGAEKKSDGLFKSMLGANIVGNAVSAGMGMAKNGISSMLGELNEASVSWQTFEGNMHQLGKSPAEIASAKADMQKFAQQTIYSASDMSTTYSQLAAVGTKNVGQLVKGFGGLAASAADPQQAMKTLSQQATQMAAKPTVQWQDFKLMLEQAPAGISAVAKSMGMSTQDMIKKIQDGKIKTQDFLNAVAKVGTNANFSKMATEYKTVGQAMDGLKETLANGLQPQFQKLSQIGIKAISSLSDKLGDLNWDSIGDGLVNAVNYVIPTFDKIKLAFDQFMDGFNDADVGDSLIDLFHSLVDALTDLMNTLDDSDDSGNSFFKILGSLSGSTISGLAKGLGALADVIGNLDPGTLRLLAVAFGILKMNTKGLVITGIVMALQLLSKLDADSLNKVAKGVTAIAIALALFKTYKKIKGTITGIADAFKKMKTPKTPKTPEVPETKTPDTGKPGKILSNAGAFMKLGAALFMVGGAIVLVGVGFKLLTDSAVKLASSGGAAIAVFFGMIAAIAVLAVLVKFLGPGMIAASVGFLMFAAALLIIGVAIFIASAGMALLATQLPIISQYGTSAALGILALAGAMAVFGLAAIIGAIGIVVLAVALVALAIGLAIAAVGALLLGVALIVVGVGALVAAVGMIMLGIGLALVAVFVMIAAVGMILLGVGLGLVAAFSIIGAIGLMLMAVALMLIAVSGIIAAVGLMLMAVALMLVAPVAMIAAVGILLLGVAVIVLGAGLLIVAAALMLVAAAMIMVGAAAMMMVA